MSRKMIDLRSAMIPALVAGGLTLAMASSAWADADAAKKDLQDAKAAFDNNDSKTADDDLRLAEAELDGVPADVKTSILNDIKTLRDKMNGEQADAAKIAAKKNVESLLEEAKKALDAPDSFDSDDKAIQEFLAKDDTKALLGDEAIAKYLKTLATYRTVERSKLVEANLAAAKDRLDKAEHDWPDASKAMGNTDAPGDQQSASDNFSRELDAIEPLLTGLPLDNPDAKAVRDRFAKLQAGYKTELYKAKAAETLARLKDGWEGYADEYKGWDAETTGPSFEDLIHHQGDDWSKLNAPKTVGLVTRANDMLGNWMKDDVIHTLVQSDAKVKGYIDKVKADRKAAMDKLATFASAVLDQAEKTEIKQNGRDRLEQLSTDDLPYCMAGSEQLKGLQDRAMKIVRAFDAKVGGDAAAHQKLYDDLVAAGAKAWPAMAAKVEASEDFDAAAIMHNPDSFKGKSFRLKGVGNRMGWDYSPGNGYEFALTSKGTPVVARYDTNVKAAVKEIEKRTAKELPEEDYDVIATVEDVGPVIRIARATGDIKTTGGETVGTVTSQSDETTQGVRLKIIALHVGAVTVAEDQGLVGADGSVGPVPAQ